MRIQSRFIILFLFVALSVSGWGNMVMSAFCAHMVNAASVAHQNEDDSCCPTGLTNQETHCNTTSEQTTKVSPEAHQENVTVDVAASDGSSFHVTPPCNHCLNRSVPNPAYVTLREKSQTRRVTDALPTYASQSHRAHQISFKLPITSRQGAPPGAPTRSHVLLNIFLI